MQILFCCMISTLYWVEKIFAKFIQKDQTRIIFFIVHILNNRKNDVLLFQIFADIQYAIISKIRSRFIKNKELPEDVFVLLIVNLKQE